MATPKQSPPLYAWVPTKEESGLSETRLRHHIRHKTRIDRFGGQELYDGALWKKLEPSLLLDDPDEIPHTQEVGIKSLLDGAYAKFVANQRQTFQAPLTFAERAKGVRKPATFEAYLGAALAAAKRPGPAWSWDFPKRVKNNGYTEMWRGTWPLWQVEKLEACLRHIHEYTYDHWDSTAFD